MKPMTPFQTPKCIDKCDSLKIDLNNLNQLSQSQTHRSLDDAEVQEENVQQR